MKVQSTWTLLKVLSILLLVWPLHGGELRELDTKNLLLLNVAVKARLVERLTDAVTRIETLRERMVEYVKACLLNVSSTVEVCKTCVKDACQKRANECKADISKLETFSPNTEKQSIPGVQFLKNPEPLEQGLEIMTEKAHDEILDTVPSDLKSEGEGLINKADDKLRTLQEKLQSSVKELPGLIPRVTDAIQSIDTDFDPDSLVKLADKTVGTITKAFEEKDDIAGTIDVVVGQLPDLISQMNEKMVTMTAAMGTFVSRATSRFGDYINDGDQQSRRLSQPQIPPRQQLPTGRLQMSPVQQIPLGPQRNSGRLQAASLRQQQIHQNEHFTRNPSDRQQLTEEQHSLQNHEDPNGRDEHWNRVKQQLPEVVNNVWGVVRKNVPRLFNEMWTNVKQQIPPNWSRQRTPQITGSPKQRNDHWTVKRIDISGNGHIGRGFVISHSSRYRRDTSVTCHDLKVNPVSACDGFHFKCPACFNETVILKQECGPDAMKMIVAIKKIDLKAADYVMTYSKHIKRGLVVKKVEYDPDSFDESSATYKSAYVTAKIRNEIVRYHTTLLPNLFNLTLSGGEIGDEIWMILDEDDSNNNISTKFEKKTHSLTHQQSSAAVNTAVYSVVGFIMYLGFIVL